MGQIVEWPEVVTEGRDLEECRGLRMSETMRYFQEEDVIHIAIKPGNEANSFEVSPNITVELDAEGDIIGVEIIEASKYIRDGLLESINAKLVQAGFNT